MAQTVSDAAGVKTSKPVYRPSKKAPVPFTSSAPRKQVIQFKQPAGGTSGQSGSNAAVNRRTKSSTQRKTGGTNTSARSGQSVRGAAPQAVPVAAPGPVQPVVPDIEQFLAGDVGYQDQLRSFSKALSDYLADLNRNRTDLETTFQTSSKGLADQRLLDLEQLEDQYAAQGLLSSGLYGEAVGDYEKGYGEQVAELGRTRSRGLEDLLAGETQFRGEQATASEAAKNEAIRRRAAQYGV